jgi:arginine/lysine/ornithine decarboxylase
MVSANFVIPYPPGFPIMVPGQVIAQDTIDFMRKLDVKEIHGYDQALGLKLIVPQVLGEKTTAIPRADKDGKQGKAQKSAPLRQQS